MNEPTLPYEEDPRLGSRHPSSYDRQQIIQSVTAFCEFLTELPYVEPSEVLHPPENGWPNITKQKLAALSKNDEVIELLARLPYISTRGDEGWCMIAPNTHLLDFRGDSVQKALEGGADLENPPNYVPPFIELPPWVVSLTTGGKHGWYLLLDTSDGTITRYGLQIPYFEPDYASGERRQWRNECTNDTKPCGDYLRGLEERLRSLEFIPSFEYAMAHVLFPGDAPKDAEVLRSIYREHGWPEHFKRDECRRALIEWDHSRT